MFLFCRGKVSGSKRHLLRVSGAWKLLSSWEVGSCKGFCSGKAIGPKRHCLRDNVAQEGFML